MTGEKVVSTGYLEPSFVMERFILPTHWATARHDAYPAPCAVQTEFHFPTQITQLQSNQSLQCFGAFVRAWPFQRCSWFVVKLLHRHSRGRSAMLGLLCAGSHPSEQASHGAPKMHSLRSLDCGFAAPTVLVVIKPPLDSASKHLKPRLSPSFSLCPCS